jgi:D-alanyl-D-alanine carboxypeptidase/D-alanyl-D-alanine-endopeptidase (penicillin-binding protein 4)
MATLIAQMLQFSDNSLGENIARVVSKEWSGGGSSASIGTIIPGIIANLGLDTRTITVRDGSGLSASNLVPPVFMAQLMAKVAVGEQELGVIKSAMPVAGKTGSLRSRFTGSSEIARGQVFAKTGWINGSRTLSGWLNAQDGSVLSFAFYALGPVQEDATVALDAVTTGAFMCGNNLSNN